MRRPGKLPFRRAAAAGDRRPWAPWKHAMKLNGTGPGNITPRASVLPLLSHATQQFPRAGRASLSPAHKLLRCARHLVPLWRVGQGDVLAVLDSLLVLLLVDGVRGIAERDEVGGVSQELARNHVAQHKLRARGGSAWARWGAGYGDQTGSAATPAS